MKKIFQFLIPEHEELLTRRMTGSKTVPKRSLADIVSPTYLYSVSGSVQLIEAGMEKSRLLTTLSNLNVPNIGTDE